MKTKYIKDPKTGENILPITSPSAVIDENGTSMNTRLTNDESKISSNITRITKVEHDIDNTYTKQEVDNLITTPNVKYENYQATTETSIDQILPAQGKSDTIYKIGSWDGTNTVVDTSVYSEYTWNGTIYKLLAVRSSFNDVFDISEATGNSYETLSAALTAANSIIPSGRKKGGMSIKFVQSSDNKYVQYMLMLSGSFTDTQFTNTANWQGVDDVPTAGSDNLIKSRGVYEKVNKLEQRIGVYSFLGYGNSTIKYSENYYNLISGKKYRLYFRNTDWVIPVTKNKFAMQNFYDGVQSDILLIGPNEDVKEYYDITIPENSEYVRFISRSSASVPIEILIYPIDDKSLEESRKLYGSSIFEGKGNTLSNSTIIPGLIPGRKYRILVPNRTWDITGVNPGMSVFVPQAITIDGQVVDLGLGEATTDMPLASSYDFTLPDNCSSVQILGRAAVGVFVEFDIVDITDIEHIKSTKQDILQWVYNDAILTPGYFINAQEGITERPNRGCIQQYLEIDKIGCLYGGAFSKIVCILYDDNKNRILDTGWLDRNIVTQTELMDFVSGAKYVRFSMEKSSVVTSEDWFLITKSNVLVPLKEDAEIKTYTERQLTISDVKNELLCQCPSVLYSDGYLFIGYYASKVNKREAPTDNTILCRLAKINVSNRTDAEYTDVLKCGDIVGDFAQSTTYPPYDPQLIDFGSRILYLMTACPNVETDCRYVARIIDKESLSMENTITPLTFTYSVNGNTYNAEIKTSDLNVFIDRVMGRTEGTSRNGSYPILSNIEYYDGYYYSWLGGLQNNDRTGYMGCLIRSSNGIDWELVTCPTQFSSITRCWEAAIAIMNGLVYVFWRFAKAPRAYYNISTGVWSDLKTTLTNYGNSRNFLFRKGDYIYGFANVQSTITTPAGNVPRTEMAVLKFDTDFNIIWQKTIQSDFGLVYPVILQISAGEYLICASNRRWDYGASPLPVYPCSEISSILINGLMD